MTPGVGPSMVGVVLSNLMYLVVAVGAIIFFSLIVVLRHRRPRSVEANMRTFHRGLEALAPDNPRGDGRVTARPRPRPAGTPPVHVIAPGSGPPDSGGDRPPDASPSGGDDGVPTAETG
ncbi:MAG: hypothetical protein ACRDY0_07820 [Acidimicrobiales bacterium]